MKKLISLLLFCIGFFSFANDIDGKVTAVTIYRSGAYVKRLVEVTLTSGQNSFTLKGLPKDIDPNSVLVKGYGNFIIGGVQTAQNFLQNAAEHEKVKPLTEKKKQLERELAISDADLDALKNWEDFLNQNKAVTGTETPMSSDNFIKLEQNYRKNIREVKQNIVAQTYTIQEKTKELDKIKNEINQLSSEINTQTSEITINTEGKIDQKVKLEVTYFTRMAYWVPKYRLTVEDVANPLILNYQASINQNTGENWNKVELIFSSANPSNNQTLPIYSVLPLKFYEPVVHRSTPRVMAMKSASPEVYNDAAVMVAEADMAYATTPSVQYADEANFFEYKLNQPYSVLTGSKNIEITFNEEKIATNYLYKTIPYADPTAYLIAKVSDWQKLNVLPGEASIYFNNSYVGKIYLDTKNMSINSEISLGKDERIQVTRKNILGNKKSAGFIGNKTVREYDWQNTIINQRNKSIEIEVVERVPLSKDNEIDLEFKTPEGAIYEESTGKLSWTIKIEPSKTFTTHTKYNIKYPKDKTVEGLPY